MKLEVDAKYVLLSETVAAEPTAAMAQVCANRGIGDDGIDVSLDDLAVHLSGIGNLDKAARLFASHMAKGSLIVICGDYDADGTTSVAQLVLFMKDSGYDRYETVIPDRFADGYGMPAWVPDRFPDAGLFVTVDCGTLDRAIFDCKAKTRADVLVIDHHEIAATAVVAPSDVLVNPKHPDNPAPFKEFCASGLVLLFLIRLGGLTGTPVDGRHLALAAVGTVADLVPLESGNRVIVREGLSAINQHRSRGISDIVESGAMKAGKISSGVIAFQIGPRINAAGRMTHAREALEVLTGVGGRQGADRLSALNASRQEAEKAIIAEVAGTLEAMEEKPRSLVLSKAGWSSGVVGICASKVQERYLHVPVILLEEFPDKGVAKGSARSISGVNIHSLLERCDDLLEKWGGHEQAAGMTVRLSALPAFRERLESLCREMDEDIFVKKVKVDCVVTPDVPGEELFLQAGRLAPFGMGNPAPVFAMEASPISVRKFGKGNAYVEYGFMCGGERVSAVDWNADGKARVQPVSDPAWFVFKMKWDDYTGNASMDLVGFGHDLPGLGKAGENRFSAVSGGDGGNQAADAA